MPENVDYVYEEYSGTPQVSSNDVINLIHEKLENVENCVNVSKEKNSEQVNELKRSIHLIGGILAFLLLINIFLVSYGVYAGLTTAATKITTSTTTTPPTTTTAAPQAPCDNAKTNTNAVAKLKYPNPEELEGAIVLTDYCGIAAYYQGDILGIYKTNGTENGAVKYQQLAREGYYRNILSKESDSVWSAYAANRRKVTLKSITDSIDVTKTRWNFLKNSFSDIWEKDDCIVIEELKYINPSRICDSLQVSGNIPSNYQGTYNAMSGTYWFGRPVWKSQNEKYLMADANRWNICDDAFCHQEVYRSAGGPNSIRPSDPIADYSRDYPERAPWVYLDENDEWVDTNIAIECL